jgi:drug/metabolite transporter (DMT)-like permease
LNGAEVLYALIFLMVVFWSGNYIAGKIALREFSPLLLAGLRIGLAGLIMALIRLAHALVRAASRLVSTPSREKGVERGVKRSDVARLLLLGLLGVTLNQVLFVVGLSRTSVAHAAILIGLTPIQVLIVAGVRRQERITTRKAMGMAIALAGVAVLKVFEPAPAYGAGPTWTGDFIVLLAGLAFALFTVFGKEVTERYSTITMNTYAYVGGALALLPLTVWEATRQPLADIGAGAWLAVTYMALFPSVIAYLIYYHALARMTASRVSAFSYLQPVFAAIMGVAILGETLGPPVIAGGLVILGGVYLAERG